MFEASIVYSVYLVCFVDRHRCSTLVHLENEV